MRHIPRLLTDRWSESHLGGDAGIVRIPHSVFPVPLYSHLDAPRTILEVNALASRPVVLLALLKHAYSEFADCLQRFDHERSTATIGKPSCKCVGSRVEPRSRHFAP